MDHVISDISQRSQSTLQTDTCS